MPSPEVTEGPVDHVAWQLARFREQADAPAMIWRGDTYTFQRLADGHERWRAFLEAHGVAPGASVGIVGDYSPASVTLLLALMRRRAVAVPLARESRAQHDYFTEAAELDHLIELDADDQPTLRPVGARRNHPLLEALRADGDAGLIVFTSGSTGHPKAILHAWPPLLEKFRTLKRTYRTVNFLLFDHLGGLNTLFYTLANLGCTVVPRDRSVAGVCDAIARHRVELLPTSPSFLNLMLLQNAGGAYDLSSLKLITYGTEVMPERTLAMAREAFPEARFQQTYGLSELGVMRSRSKGDGSLLVRIGGEGFETAVRNGTLWIRSSASMRGYLNAPSPFDEDGWFDTGDTVIEDGGFFRILGRQSDIINVGGQKVYPLEVEKVVAELPDVIDVAVKGEPHLILGQMVVAIVQTAVPVPASDMKRRIAEHCRGRLQPYMVPARVRVIQESPVNYRFKKVRQSTAADE